MLQVAILLVRFPDPLADRSDGGDPVYNFVGIQTTIVCFWGIQMYFELAIIKQKLDLINSMGETTRSQ